MKDCLFAHLPRLGRCLLVCFATVALLIASTPPLMASDPCNPPNVMPQSVCDFDEFSGQPPREAPVGWTIFVLSGEPAFINDPHSFWGSGTLRIWSNGGTFKAGIYTQVNVTPGTGYRASNAWGAPNAPDLFGRQLGLDPFGGTDPNSPNVVWGPMHWGEGRILNYTDGGPNIDVRARAVGNTMTVFFLTDHPTSSGDNLIYIDAIALYPDDSAPAAPAAPVAPPETPTSPPPAEQPAIVSVPAQAAPVAAAPSAQIGAAAVAPAAPLQLLLPPDTPTSSANAATATLEPTPSLASTNTPKAPVAVAQADTSVALVPSAANNAAPTPTWTPWPTAAPTTVAIAFGGLVNSLGEDNSRSSLLLVGGLSLLGALLFGTSLWRLRKRTTYS